MNSKNKIRSGFNFLSSFYDLLVKLFFGNSILRAQTHFLPQLKKCDTLLIFGGGTGRILVECIRQDIAKKYCYVDISEKMIAKAQVHLKQSGYAFEGKVAFICGSYTDLPVERCDCIITPFVLDCFAEEELPKAMRALDERLQPNGQWLFADFNIPPKGVMRFLSRIIIRTLYFFFNITTGIGVKKLPAFERTFAALHYKKEKEEYRLKGMLVTRIYSRQ